jgi:hypothetical protein
MAMVMGGHKLALVRGEQTIMFSTPLVLLLCIVSYVGASVLVLLMIVVPQLWSCSPFPISCVQGAIVKIQG